MTTLPPAPQCERILGIDPGTASTGFAVLERRRTKLVPLWYDCLRTAAGDAPALRLLQIREACQAALVEFEPQSVAIEGLFAGVNPQVALAVGQARGVLMVTCVEAGVDVHEYTPAAIKMAVTGFGRADKHQVQQMVQNILGMSEVPRPDHAADAFAAAICHAGASRLQQATERVSSRTRPRV